ncbi:Sulfotransferase 1C4-like 7 [Homarus americanus]|uniref:Sulfotransferase 1C4-like 7 n=1 Tax=Homarus americanus TaxID=6706 RepID=A0A8J5MJE8_HOMAM|nr:Sulfotransferase 1C4-like 7 [Homarus americanus]
MEPLASGHETVPLGEDDEADMKKYFAPFPGGTIRLNPGSWVFPAAFLKYADKIYNFQCGTTWMQEIVWTMRNNPDLLNPTATLPIMTRVPFIDNSVEGINHQLAVATPDPRTIKTHIPLSLLHPTLLNTCKVVYVARNPLDVVVSLLHHFRLIKTFNFRGSLDNIIDFFVSDKLRYLPFWRHVNEAWQKRHHPNFHFVFYEDLKADIMAELEKLNEFLSTNLSQEQLLNVANYTEFNEMAGRDNLMGPKAEDNPRYSQEVVRQEGGFFRKGEVGNWKEKLNPKQVDKIDKWTKKNMREIPFKYIL